MLPASLSGWDVSMIIPSRHFRLTISHNQEQALSREQHRCSHRSLASLERIERTIQLYDLERGKLQIDYQGRCSRARLRLDLEKHHPLHGIFSQYDAFLNQALA